MRGPKIPPTRNGSQGATRSMTAPPRRSRATSQTVVLRIHPTRFPAGSMVIADSLSGRDQRRRPGQGRLDRQAPTAKVSEKDMQDHAAKLIADPNGGVLLAGRRRRYGAAFRAARSTLEANLHHRHRPALPDGAGERARLREGRHVGNPHRQPVAEPGPAHAGQGARRPETDIVMRTYLLGGGFGRRLNGDYAVPRGAGRQGARQAGEDGPDARRRRAVRLVPLALGAEAADGVRRRRQGHGHGASRVAPAGRRR